SWCRLVRVLDKPGALATGRTSVAGAPGWWLRDNRRNDTQSLNTCQAQPGAGRVLGGVAGPAVPISRDKAFVIFVGIDAKTSLFDNANANRVPQRQYAELFQFLQLLQRFGRQRRQAQQELSAVSVQTEVLKEACWAQGEVGLAVAHEGDGTAAE